MGKLQSRLFAGAVAGLLLTSSLAVVERPAPAAAAEDRTQAVRFVPGWANLNMEATGTDVSCSDREHCMAVGFVADFDGFYRPYASVKSGGTWQLAEEVPVDAAVSGSREAGPFVHCTGHLECTVVVGADEQGLLAVGYADGTWGTPQQLSLPRPFPQGPWLTSYECSTGGGCVAVARVSDKVSDHLVVFDQLAGSWSAGQVIDFPMVPGNETHLVTVTDTSCAPDGSCSVVGFFKGNELRAPDRSYVVAGSGGTWAPAAAFTAPDPSQLFLPDALSCAAPGSCVAAGRLVSGPRNPTAALAREVEGRWGVPGPVAFEPGAQSAKPSSQLLDVSCTAAASCTAVGNARDANGAVNAVATSLSEAGWSTASVLRFSPDQTAMQPASSLLQLRCFDATTCTAFGSVTDAQRRSVGFSANMVGGRRGDPRFLSQPSDLGSEAYQVISSGLDCGDVDRCTATGFADASTGHYAFVYDVGFAPSHFQVLGSTEVALASGRLGAHAASGRSRGAKVNLRLKAKGLPAPRFEVLAGLPAGLTHQRSTISGQLARRGSFTVKVRVQNRWGSIVRLVKLKAT